MYFCTLYFWNIESSLNTSNYFPHTEKFMDTFSLHSQKTDFKTSFSSSDPVLTSGCHIYCVLKQAPTILFVDGKWSWHSILLQQTRLTSSSHCAPGRSVFTGFHVIWWAELTTACNVSFGTKQAHAMFENSQNKSTQGEMFSVFRSKWRSSGTEVCSKLPFAIFMIRIAVAVAKAGMTSGPSSPWRGHGNRETAASLCRAPVVGPSVSAMTLCNE